MATTVEEIATNETELPRYAPPPYTLPPTLSERTAALYTEVRKTPGRAAMATLAAAMIVIALVALRPVSVSGADEISAFKAKCGISIYVFGNDSGVVQQTCRDAFAGRAVVFFFAAAGAIFAAAALAVLLARPVPEPSPTRTRQTLSRRLVRTPSRAALLTLDAVLLVVAVGSLFPVRAHGEATTGAFSAQCGITFFVKGHDDPAVEQACHKAYGGHAMTFVVSTMALIAGTVALGMSARRDEPDS
jgi:hypothetical protein